MDNTRQTTGSSLCFDHPRLRIVMRSLRQSAGRQSLGVLLALGVVTSAQAMEVGRASLVSAPGAPLVVNIPVRQLTTEEASSLSARVASAAQWQQAGLTPPVPLNELQVRVVPGPQADSRTIEVTASKAAAGTVIDVLLDVDSAAASRVVQSSLISTPAPGIRGAGEVHDVQRGETLFDIARQFEVPGAHVHQMLWALFEANPDAFLRKNMNLLQAGKSLNIPSAAEVLAVNPRFATEQYQAQLRAFQAGRGQAGAAPVSARAGAVQVATPEQTTTGQVQTGQTPEPQPPARDRVRLSAAGEAGTQADAQDRTTSGQHQQAEMQDRLRELEQNVTALKEVLAAAGLPDPTVTDETAAGGEVRPNAQAVASATSDGTSTVAQTGREVSGAQAGTQTAGTATDEDKTAAESSASRAADRQSASIADTASGQDVSSARAAGTTGAAVSSSDASAQGETTSGAARTTPTTDVNSSTKADATTDSKTVQTASAVTAGEQSAKDRSDATADSAQTVSSVEGSDSNQASERTGKKLGETSETSSTKTETSKEGADSSQTTTASSEGKPAHTLSSRDAEGQRADTASSAQQADASDSSAENLWTWVLENILATAAIVIALIALLFAWLMRSRAARDSQAVSQAHAVEQARAFEERLEDIDLDLDSPTDDETPGDKSTKT